MIMTWIGLIVSIFVFFLCVAIMLLLVVRRYVPGIPTLIYLTIYAILTFFSVLAIVGCWRALTAAS